MLACAYCESSLPERAVFCPSCAKQARCKECRDLLEPNAKACVDCGTIVGEGTLKASFSNSPAPSKNTLILRETKGKASRELEVGFSDNSVESISEGLIHILVDRLGESSIPRRGTNGSPLRLTSEAVPESKDYIDAEAAEVVVNGTATLNQEAKTDKEKLHQVFYYNGDILKLDNYNLKADGQLDAAKRLVYLFLYAHELEGRKTVSRELINAALKDVGLFDANASNWISTTLDLAKEGDEDANTFRLRANGREAAQKALADIFNPEKVNKIDLSKITPRKKAKSGNADSSDKDSQTGTNQTSKKSSEVDSWVTKWTNLKLEVDAYTAIGSASPENKGIIALWAIRKATSDEVKVVNGNKIVAFISKAFHKNPDRSNLVRALEERAVGKVRRTPDGYELTDEGMKHAEEILKFKPESDDSAAKGKKPSKSK
jgi:hypothetical protein